MSNRIIFHLTYNCNGRCQMCHRWQTPPLTNELTLKEIKQTQLPSNTTRINLSGGDPIKRKDLTQILQYFISKPTIKEILVSTLGHPYQTLKDVIDQTLDSKEWKQSKTQLRIAISLDGTKEIHNTTRGVPAAYDNSFASIKYLQKITKENPRIHLTIGTVVTKYNINNIPALTEFLTSEGLRQNLSLFIADDEGYNNQNSPVPPIETLSYVKQFVHSQPQGIISKTFTRINWACKMERAYKNKMPMPCTGHSLTIEPDGEIHPCNYWNFTLGNLRNCNYNLNRMIESEKYKESEKLIQKNKCPTCWSTCHAVDTLKNNSYQRPHKLIKYYLQTH